MIPTLMYERRLWKQGFSRIAGVDEVGRGALAGPVVVAALILSRSDLEKASTGSPPDNNPARSVLAEVRDSKRLSAKKRRMLSPLIKSHCIDFSYGQATAAEIDRIGIVKATQRAMRRAVKNLQRVDFVLVDAFFIPYLIGVRRKRQIAIKHGDALCFSIAAASILAKVHRDRLMKKLGVLHPQYKLEQHKGYGTSAHRRAITRFGPKRFHRKTFMRNLILDQ